MKRRNSGLFLMMLRITACSFLAALALSITFGAGCDAGEAAKSRASREPARVLGATFLMAEVARAVGGERVRAEWWIESGQSLEELTDTPQRRQQLNQVDLVITRGQVDPWTLVGSGNLYQDRRVLRIDTLPAARDLDATSYLWLDPQVGRELAEELLVRLGAMDPSNAGLFRSNTDAFIRELDTLTRGAQEAVDKIGGGPFVTLDRGFNSLARRFGLDEVKIAMVDLREPTAFNVKLLRQSVEKAGGGAVFANAQTPPALLRDWESRLGLPVLPLEPLGTSAQTGRSTYLQVLRYNLEQLTRGVSLGKPRERQLPGPMGAVQWEPSKLPPPPPDLVDLDRAATAPATTQATEETSSTPRVAPMERPSLERLKLNLPRPTTRPATSPKTAPLPLLPFRPVPQK